MNITFWIIADLNYFQWCMFGYLLLCSGGVFYLGLRFVRVLDRWVTVYGQRKESAIVVGPSSSIAGQFNQVGQTSQEIRRPTTTTVPEVSPELILKRAPKPTGFGGQGNGSKQSD